MTNPKQTEFPVLYGQSAPRNTATAGSGPPPPPPIRARIGHFSEHDPRWRCCCGSIHVKDGARYVALYTLGSMLVGIVLAVIGVVLLAQEHAQHHDYGEEDFSASSSSYRSRSAVHANRFIRLYDQLEDKGPWIAGFVIAFAVACVVMEVVVLALILIGVKNENKCNLVPYIVLGVASSILLLLNLNPYAIVQIWFTFVVFRCYQYLAAKEMSSAGVPSSYVLNYQPAAPPPAASTFYDNAQMRAGENFDVNGTQAPPPTYEQATAAKGGAEK